MGSFIMIHFYLFVCDTNKFVTHTHKYVYIHLGTCGVQTEEGVRSPRSGDAYSCELPCRCCWEPGLGPLQELLTTELSIQLQDVFVCLF